MKNILVCVEYGSLSVIVYWGGDISVKELDVVYNGGLNSVILSIANIRLLMFFLPKCMMLLVVIVTPMN